MAAYQAYARFQKAADRFNCPVCGAEMTFREPNSLVCRQGHCFDIAKQGYVHFARHTGKTKYTKTLFESRRHILKAGFYSPLQEKLEQLIRAYTHTCPIPLLDAGCGEGYFAANLFADRRETAEVYALDLVKDAIRLAAKENRDVKWMVGDLTRIPLRPASIDVVLNILAPAHYGEFARILSPDGVVIKVVPGRQYLCELRAQAGGQPKEQAREQIADYFAEKMTPVARIPLCYQVPVTQWHREHLVQMTPLLFHVAPAKLRMEELTRLTIDLEILVGRKAPRSL